MTTTLKSVLDATVDALTLNPAAGTKQVAVDSVLVGPCEVAVHIGDRLVTVDQPEGLGGGVAPTRRGQRAAELVQLLALAPEREVLRDQAASEPALLVGAEGLEPPTPSL